jgi:hypothetical protein
MHARSPKKECAMRVYLAIPELPAVPSVGPTVEVPGVGPTVEVPGAGLVVEVPGPGAVAVGSWG